MKGRIAPFAIDTRTIAELMTIISGSSRQISATTKPLVSEKNEIMESMRYFLSLTLRCKVKSDTETGIDRYTSPIRLAATDPETNAANSGLKEITV